MKTRQIAPDFVKGIAIVLMVYGHLTMVGSWASWRNHAAAWIYSFHMPLFLMISGMFFSVEGETGKKIKKLCLLSALVCDRLKISRWLFCSQQCYMSLCEKRT